MSIVNVECPIYGGGIFSKVMLLFQITEQHVGHLSSLFSIYAVNLDDRIDSTLNPFDFIFEQKRMGYEEIMKYHTYPSFRESIPPYYLDRLQKIAAKLKINPEVKSKFDEIHNSLNFDNNVLGVHLRLTDMNTLHGDDYGNKTFNDYIKVIDSYLKENDVKQIYVAADNNESLNKLIDRYGNKILYYRDFFRPDNEDATVNFQLDNFSDKKLWQDSFIDMLLLAQTNVLIHRVSNFANAAKVFSKTITKSIVI
jgi:hypothetical protein